MVCGVFRSCNILPLRSQEAGFRLKDLLTKEVNQKVYRKKGVFFLDLV